MKVVLYKEDTLKLGWTNPHGRQVKSTLHKFLDWFNNAKDVK